MISVEGWRGRAVDVGQWTAGLQQLQIVAVVGGAAVHVRWVLATVAARKRVHRVLIHVRLAMVRLAHRVPYTAVRENHKAN